MRNKAETTAGTKLLSKISLLPYFDIRSARTLINDTTYLRIILSRYSKSGKILRLKKGVYTTKTYVDNVQKKGLYTSYVEFIATALYPNSYLSMEYVLQKYNALTESTINFTLVSKDKTTSFSNPLGRFIYHNIKDNLFLGFRLITQDGFNIYEASKAKALFDYIYLRKPALIDEKAVLELRINSEVFEKADIKEFNGYIKLDGSEKMKKISKTLFE